jgi:hypothetical protein
MIINPVIFTSHGPIFYSFFLSIAIAEQQNKYPRHYCKHRLTHYNTVYTENLTNNLTNRFKLGGPRDYTVQKVWKANHYAMRVLKNGKRKKSLAYKSEARRIVEYGSACWDPCREGQIIALDRGQNKDAQFTNHTTDADWENLPQRRTIARLRALFKAYSGERA